MKSSERYLQVKSPKSGSFAQVTGCKDKQTGGLVAFKQLLKANRENKEYIYRFRREVSLLEDLAPHENIVPVLDKCLDDDDNWYVMPYATFNLGEFMDRYNSEFPIEERIKLFDTILVAMTHAHQRNILHRDLAPTNVLLYLEDQGTDAYDVKIADFGLGRNMKSLSAFTKTAQEGYGHAYYTAPEQLHNLKSASYQSDIYSLGKLLNYVCTGRIPNTYHHCDFGSVIKKATETEPQKRYEDIRAFVLAYEEIKELLTKIEEQTIEERMIAYADGTLKIDWHDFHRYAVAGEHMGHVYYDYLEPIAKVLTNQEAVNAYSSIVGSAIEEFVATYIDRIEECLRMTGWPFKETDTFGYILYYVYQSTDSADIRVECIRELWRLGYISDQWAVQRLVEKIFTSGILPSGHEVEVAHIIRTSGAQLNDEQVRKLTEASLPRVIRQVLRDLSIK